METQEDLKKLLNKGLAQLRKGNYVDAVFSFEELLFKSDRSAISLSCLGLAMARGRLDLNAAQSYCREAVQKSPQKGDFYLALAEVYQLKRDKLSAIKTLQKGLKIDKTHKGLNREMKKFGVRKEPILPFLTRSNMLNRFLGHLSKS